jgi:hypothetical protein
MKILLAMDTSLASQIALGEIVARAWPSGFQHRDQHRQIAVCQAAQRPPGALYDSARRSGTALAQAS